MFVIRYISLFNIYVPRDRMSFIGHRKGGRVGHLLCYLAFGRDDARYE